MKKASILLTYCLPAWLLAGCTLVFAEGEPEPKPVRPQVNGTAGTHQGDAGSPSDGGGGESSEGGAGGGATTVPSGGAGGEGGTVNEDPAGGHGGAATTAGLGAECADESTCLEAAPECPSEAGFCTFYCDEAWVDGWQAVPKKVAECEELGGECTPIGEDRSFCVP